MDANLPKPACTLIGRQENATYTTSPLQRYKDNPLIESLPAILTTEEVAHSLTRKPHYDPGERKLPSELRYHAIESARDLFIPLEVHLSLEERISRLVRGGYVPRNPLFKEHWANLDTKVTTLSDSILNPRTRPVHAMAPSMNIIGISGGGKTTAIQNVLDLYPQVIWHSSYRGVKFHHTQLVWLKITCPFDGSTKGICQNFFEATDDVLGTNTVDRYTKARQTAHELLPSMARVAAINNLGVLIVDEVQHIQGFKSGGREAMLNFFCELVNTMCLPVVLIGTYKAAAILASDFRLIRRGCGTGDFAWHAMQMNDEFEYFVESIWPYQYTRSQTPLTSELCSVLFNECQGITDLCVRLYMLSQAKAISTQQEKITPDLVRQVASECLSTAQPVLKALRNKSVEELMKFDDVCPPDFRAQMQQIRRAAVIRIPKGSGITSPSIPDQKASTAQAKRERACTHLPVITPPPPGEGLVSLCQAALKKKVAAYPALKAGGFIADAEEILNLRPNSKVHSP